MKLSKSRKKKCAKGIHVYGSEKYVRTFGLGQHILIKEVECIYCGKKLRSEKT